MSPTAASSRRVLVTVLIGVAATSFPITILSASLPTIAEDFGTTESTISWVITLPTLGFAVAMPILGKLGDLHGHRRVYLWGFTAAVVFATLTTLAWNAPSLIVLRMFGQMCGAATMPAAIALIVTAFPAHERVRAMGWWALVSAGAPAAGLAIGGPLIDLVGWRPVFLVQAVVGAVALVSARSVLPETPRVEVKGFDIRGAVTLGVGVSAALFALNQAERLGWSHPLVLGGFGLAPLVLAGFVLIERRHPAPLLPLTMFRRRNFAVTATGHLFMQSAYMGALVLAPFLLDNEFGYSANAITAILVLRPLTFSLCGPVAGRIAVRIGERRTGLIGTTSVTIGMLLLAYAAATRDLTAVIAGFVVSGAGHGFYEPPFQASMANAVPDTDLGVASASKQVAGHIGAAIGITLMTTLREAGDATSTGFATAFGVAAGLGAVGLVISLAVEDTPRGSTEPSARIPRTASLET